VFADEQLFATLDATIRRPLSCSANAW
jgi:50S ribosomal subunit-associated GTPase HflX